MNIADLMQTAGKLKEQMQQAQERAAKVTAHGEAGAGMARVVVNGRFEVLEVKIDPSIVSSTEVGLLEDMVRAATNQAIARVREALKGDMGEVMSNMGLDLDLSSLGL